MHIVYNILWLGACLLLMAVRSRRDGPKCPRTAGLGSCRLGRRRCPACRLLVSLPSCLPAGLPSCFLATAGRPLLLSAGCWLLSAGSLLGARYVCADAHVMGCC